MIQDIIGLICLALIGFSIGAFASFVIFKLRKIDTNIDSIPKTKRHWSMGVYMDEIPYNEQNTAHLDIVPLKICERDEYSDFIVPRVGEEIGGVYCNGQHKFELKGTVTKVFYNTDIDWIVVSCKCTEIDKVY